MDIRYLIHLQRQQNMQRFGHFLFDTIKAIHNDCTLRNPDATTLEVIHASNELGSYMGKCIRKEY